MRKVSLAFANRRTECPLLENWSLVPESLYDARQTAEVLPQGGVRGWRGGGSQMTWNLRLDNLKEGDVQMLLFVLAERG